MFAEAWEVARDFPRLAAGNEEAWKGVQHVDPRLVIAVVTFLAHQLVWTSLNIFFGSLDYFQLLQRYKLPRKNQPSRKLVLRCLGEAFFNQYLISPLGQYFILAPLFLACGISLTPKSGWVEATWQMLVMTLLNDALFYWTHRALHHPLLYARFHKQHHMFNAPTSICAEMVRIWETTDTHSGYELPWSVWSLFWWQGGARQHDFHHTDNTGNYGGLATIFWDRWCGTDKAYRTHLEQLKRKDQ